MPKKHKREEQKRKSETPEALVAELREIDALHAAQVDTPVGAVPQAYYRQYARNPRAFLRHWTNFALFRAHAFSDLLHRAGIEKTVTLTGRRAKRYFVTAAVGGQTLNQRAFATITNFCKRAGAELVALIGLTTTMQKSYRSMRRTLSPTINLTETCVPAISDYTRAMTILYRGACADSGMPDNR